MSVYADLNAPKEKPKFRFRWGYVASGFLVFGVLSLTIGTEDPLVRDAKALRRKYDQTFKINKNEKTAPAKQLDGPEERTYPLDAPKLQELTREIYQFGKRISAESFSRSTRFMGDSPQIQAVAEAALIYSGMHLGLYRNYMRLAHDAEFKTYVNPGTLGTVGNAFLASLMRLSPTAANPYLTVARWEQERWDRANADAIKMQGARAFSSAFYDFLDIRLSPKVAFIFYGNKQYGKQFSIRNVKDEKGNYGQAELFLNEFEKQMAEYEAIQDPKNKAEYLKLLQFAALREGMSNRWALRRMLPEGVRLPSEFIPRSVKYNPNLSIAFSDREIRSCAPDLVSFRMSEKGSVNDIPAYRSLWQQDRYDEITDEAVVEAAATATAGKSLLAPEEYAELYLNFVSAFPEFPARVLAKFDVEGDPQRTLERVKANYLSGKWLVTDKSLVRHLSDAEEKKWSSAEEFKDEEGNLIATLVMAREKYLESNYPGDDLGIAAIAERYAHEAFAFRSNVLAHTLAEFAELDADTIDGVPVPGGGELQVVEEQNPYFLAALGMEVVEENRPSGNQVRLYAGAKDPKQVARAAELVERMLEPKAKAWRASVAKLVEKALLSKLGVRLVSSNGNPMGVGFTRTWAKKRFDAYESDVMRDAAYGARGLRAKAAAQKAMDGISAAKNRAKKCPKMIYGGATDASCWIEYQDPKTIRDPKNPVHYAGFAPFRIPAAESGMKNLLVPESADQLSQFFRKKLMAVVEFDNASLNYAEPEIAKKIAENPTVMRGIEMLFGHIAQLSAKEGSEGKVNDCGNTTSRVGKVQPNQRRSPAAASAEDCDVENNEEALRRRKALNDALIPGAKKAYEEFLKGLETPGQYRFPDRAKKRLAEIEAEKSKAAAEKAAKKKATAPVSIHRGMHYEQMLKYQKLAAAEKKKKEEEVKAAQAEAVKKNEAKKLHGYFRVGRDRSLEKTGGELFIEKREDREEAKRLYIEALGMLRLAQVVTETPATFRTKKRFLPDQIVSWVTNEHLLRRRLSRLTLLEQMVATVTDQYALGQVLADESLIRAPILTLSRDWKIPRGISGWFSKDRRGKKDDPILLERVEKYWSPSGWNEAGFREEFRSTVYSALASDLGKVETFCTADIRRYQVDPNFKLMFQSATGIRQMLSSDERIQKWDEEIAKETRTFQEKFIFLFEDLFGGHVWAMILAMILIQIMMAVFTGGSSLVLSSFAWSTVWTFVARFVALQFTGNLGLLNLAFSFQTIAMIDMYHYRAPPQLAFSFEVANSQIFAMESNRFDGTNAARFSGGSFADRDRLRTMREELVGMQVASYIAVGAEALQFRVFTYPGIRKSLGITGQKFSRALSAASTKSISEISTESLPQMIRKHGSLRKAIAEYWPKARGAILSAQRMVTVKGGDKVRRTLQEMLGDTLAKEVFPTRASLREFLAGSRRGIDEEMQALRVKANLKNARLEELKRIESQPIDFIDLGPEAEKKLAALRKTAVDGKELVENVLVEGRKLEENLPKMPAGKREKVASWFGGFKKRKLARLEQESRLLDELLQRLERIPGGAANEPETAAFLRSLTLEQLTIIRKQAAPGLTALHTRLAHRRSPKIIELDARLRLREAFRKFDYLTEDWKRSGGVTQAYQQMALHQLPHFVISGEDGAVWEAKEFVLQSDGSYLAQTADRKMSIRIDPEDFHAHPEDYISIPTTIVKGRQESMTIPKRLLRSDEHRPDVIRRAR